MSAPAGAAPTGAAAPRDVPTGRHALRLTGWGEVPVLQTEAVPVRSAGETTVAVHAATLAHLDLTVASGTFGVRPALPHLPGVEGSGTVLASDTFPVGSRVLVRGAGVGLAREGCWTDVAVVPDRAVSLVPDGMDLDTAATWYQPATTADAALTAAHLVPGDTVVVTGASGAVGSLVVQLAARAGVEVVAVVGAAWKREHVPAAAGLVLDAGQTALLAELATDRRAAALVDTTGGAGLAGRLPWVRPGGRAVVLGYTAGPSLTLDLANWLLDDVALLPLNMMRRGREAAERAAVLAPAFVSGELAVATTVRPFSEVAGAVADLREGRQVGRTVLRPTGA